MFGASDARPAPINAPISSAGGSGSSSRVNISGKVFSTWREHEGGGSLQFDPSGKCGTSIAEGTCRL